MINNIDNIEGASGAENPEEEHEAWDEKSERPKRAFYGAIMAFVKDEKLKGVPEQVIKDKIGKVGLEPELVTQKRQALKEVLGDSDDAWLEIERLQSEAFQLGLKAQPVENRPKNRNY